MKAGLLRNIFAVKDAVVRVKSTDDENGAIEQIIYDVNKCVQKL